jgi:hypothetical protein
VERVTRGGVSDKREEARFLVSIFLGFYIQNEYTKLKESRKYSFERTYPGHRGGGGGGTPAPSLNTVQPVRGETCTVTGCNIRLGSGLKFTYDSRSTLRVGTMMIPALSPYGIGPRTRSKYYTGDVPRRTPCEPSQPILIADSNSA